MSLFCVQLGLKKRLRDTAFTYFLLYSWFVLYLSLWLCFYTENSDDANEYIKEISPARAGATAGEASVHVTYAVAPPALKYATP